MPGVSGVRHDFLSSSQANDNFADKRDVDELTKEFLAESIEGLDRMDRCLTELEARPNDSELLGEIFRSVHTIKGTTGFLGFSRLEKLAHAGEHLLGLLRVGRLTADAKLIDGLLQLMDRLRKILELIELTGKEGVRAADEDFALIAFLEAFDRSEQMEAERPVSKSSDMGVSIVHGLEKSLGQTQQDAIAAEFSLSNVSKTEGVKTTGTTEKTLRIDVDVLNRMMNLVGELVLTRNQLLQSHVHALNFPELTRRLDSVTADLRMTVMQARMQPVGHLFSKFPRMVRDLAKNCGKNVRIEFSGQETGLDKSLLEAIKDPLTHAIRNAVDHGIEDSARRMLAGKANEGLICLKACHQGGSVVIEVKDDGGGISTERVLQKAVEGGLITESQAARMTPRDALQLIFLPGFSMAAKVTHVSGRGVGMDVVRANVEKVGGSVEVESIEKIGTVLRLRIPLTLAIVPALIVQSGGQSFCLPQSSLAELVYVPGGGMEGATERIGGAELYRLRDTLLPLVWLDKLLQLEGTGGAREMEGFYVAVLEAEGCRFGLAVDDLMAPEEIVVKPLSAILREIGLFSGATVLGNGTMAMILDVSATAFRAGIRAAVEPVASTLARLEEKVVLPSFVLFENRVDGQRSERMALPLSSVERIETILLSAVEYIGGRAWLQYRGELLPLQDAGGVLCELQETGSEISLTVLICVRQRHGRDAGRQRIGMIVRSVVDVAHGELMEKNVQICDGRFARVGDLLTGVDESFVSEGPWAEVA